MNLPLFVKLYPTSLSIGSFGSQGLGDPSFHLDLLLRSSSSSMPNVPPYQLVCLFDMDKSLMPDITLNVMEELIRLLQTNKPLWMKSSVDGRDVLNLETYERMFGSKNPMFGSKLIKIQELSL
ncbi:hypothetical protein VNO77_19670 [Canavalia gladiata]|uniref:START domain-containing protein n=1 Tax=Canavalia gladiata TaxID=3824 RepID=A0AAN9LMY7_CANGL